MTSIKQSITVDAEKVILSISHLDELLARIKCFIVFNSDFITLYALFILELLARGKVTSSISTSELNRGTLAKATKLSSLGSRNFKSYVLKLCPAKIQ